eukprot:Gb_17772 [translate_table: standard]
MNAQDIPKGVKLYREQAAQEYCEKPEDYSTSGIQIEGLKDQQTRWISMLMVVTTSIFMPSLPPPLSLSRLRCRMYTPDSPVRSVQSLRSVVTSFTALLHFTPSPSIFFAILLHSIPDAKLPIQQSQANLLIMHTWCSVYGRDVIAR